jgi:hypothetical protein
VPVTGISSKASASAALDSAKGRTAAVADLLSARSQRNRDQGQSTTTRAERFIRMLTLSLVLSLVEAALPARAGARLLPRQSPESSSKRDLSPEFQSEIARLAADGLDLKEQRAIALIGGDSALAAVFERKKPADPRETYELRIIESDGHAAKTIFRRAEFFFSLAAPPEIAALNGTDINGDGFKEVIVQSSSGGNCWSCNPTEIYRLANHKAELIAAGPIRKIADLDGDSRAELMVADARWEIYGGLSHAAAPWATIIYSWRNDRYVDASSDFPRYYDAEIARLRAGLQDAQSTITAEESSDDAYVGLAVALAITYAHMGQAERGVMELETLLGENAKSSEQSVRRKTILEDFKNGDSARKLKAIKHGEPML